jgi:hypothetical protein
MLISYMIVISLYNTYKISIVKSIANMIMRNSDIFNVYTVSTNVASFSQK